MLKEFIYILLFGSIGPRAILIALNSFLMRGRRGSLKPHLKALSEIPMHATLCLYWACGRSDRIDRPTGIRTRIHVFGWMCHREIVVIVMRWTIKIKVSLKIHG